MKRAPQEIRTYFVTAVTTGRRSFFQVTSHAELFIDTLQSYRQQGKFELYAFVVMPDHVHLLLTPAPEIPLEKAVQLIKGGFSFRFKSNFDVWERSYDNRRIADSGQYDACIKYIDQNPVKAGLAESYPHSSKSQHGLVDTRPAWL
jgi:putative transposase